jgi:hypothetical protein
VKAVDCSCGMSWFPSDISPTTVRNMRDWHWGKGHFLATDPVISKVTRALITKAAKILLRDESTSDEDDRLEP